jgi:hypothetical protein
MAIERVCPRCGGTTTKKTGYCRACSTEYVRERRRSGQFKPITEAAKRANSARSYARVYLRRGLIEQGACEVPGCTDPPRMHHDDFERPLAVRWRCYTHRIRRGRRYDEPDRAV